MAVPGSSVASRSTSCGAKIEAKFQYVYLSNLNRWYDILTMFDGFQAKILCTYSGPPDETDLKSIGNALSTSSYIRTKMYFDDDGNERGIDEK